MVMVFSMDGRQMITTVLCDIIYCLATAKYTMVFQEKLQKKRKLDPGQSTLKVYA